MNIFHRGKHSDPYGLISLHQDRTQGN